MIPDVSFSPPMLPLSQPSTSISGGGNTSVITEIQRPVTDAVEPGASSNNRNESDSGANANSGRGGEQGDLLAGLLRVRMAAVEGQAQSA